MRTTFVTAVFSFILFSSSVTFGFSTGIDPLSFNGWDHTLITSPTGQTFVDVFADVDVTITAIGDFDTTTGFANDWIDLGGHMNPGSHTLRFDFSAPLQLAVETNTVDSNENVMVYTLGDKVYRHHRGSPPIVQSMIGASAQGIRVQGSAFGMDPVHGASSGEIVSSSVSQMLYVTHQALAENKFERIKVGVVVPEPSGFCGLLFGVLALTCCRRLRR